MTAKQFDFLLGGINDSSGDPLSGGKVYTYEVGTTTNKTAWTEQDKSVAATNPIILDASGRAEAYGEGSYKIQIDDADDNTIVTFDNVSLSSGDGLDSYASLSGTTALTGDLEADPGSYSTGARVLNRMGSGSTNGESATVNYNTTGAANLTILDGSTSLPPGSLSSEEFFITAYEGSAMDVITCPTPSVFYRKSLSAEVTNTTDETQLLSIGLPDYAVNSSRGIRITYFVRLENDTGGTSSIVLRIKEVGGSTLATRTVSIDNGGDDISKLVMEILPYNNSATSQILFTTHYTTNSSVTSVASPGHTLDTLDFTSSIDLELTADPATASSDLTATLYHARAELL